MKYLVKLAIIMIGLGWLMVLIGGYLNIWILASGVTLLLGSVAILLYWSTVNFTWKCQKCGTGFRINLKQNITGKNLGGDEKELYCPSCQKKTVCKGTQIK